MAEGFVFNILVMLVTAIVLGEVFKRLKLPALVGHLLAGVIIGPTLLNLVHPSDSLRPIIDLCVFFLMFLAGLELHPEEIKKAGRNAIILSIIAFVTPFGLVVGVGHLLDLPFLTSLFVGLTLAITAVPVSAVVLMEFGLLKTKLGTTVMTAGIINDILALVVLAIILQLAANGGEEVDVAQVGFSIIKIAAFVGGIFALDFVLNKIKRHIPSKVAPLFVKLKTKEAGFAILIIVTFTISLIAEQAGLHFVIGTFFAGLIVYRELIGNENFEKINDVYSKITFGFFSPLFFAFIGVELYAQAVADVFLLFALLLAIAIIGKIVGGFVGAKLAGFSKNDSKTIGYLMNSRGMVELVIALIGLETGLIDHTLFSVLVAVGFITTIMAPIMARFSLRHSKNIQVN